MSDTLAFSVAVPFKLCRILAILFHVDMIYLNYKQAKNNVELEIVFMKHCAPL